jgi:glutathione S-transferase
LSLNSNKPESLFLASPKGTVPVLVLDNGQVLDESFDIMNWALRQNDPEHWIEKACLKDAKTLIHWNDSEFKYYLDRYKYADRYPEFSAFDYRLQAERFLTELEQRLHQNAYLCSDHFSLVDAAILPFIRQFAAVDSIWFTSAPYPFIQQWLNEFVTSNRFIAMMKKYDSWKPGNSPIKFGH